MEHSFDIKELKTIKTLVLTSLPLTHSVARELDAIAEPQPNVLNLASIIFPFSSTRNCNNRIIVN